MDSSKRSTRSHSSDEDHTPAAKKTEKNAGKQPFCGFFACIDKAAGKVAACVKNKKVTEKVTSCFRPK